jgi:hypothetical protein
VVHRSIYSLGHAADEIYRDVIGPIILKLRAGKQISPKEKNISQYLRYVVSRYTKDKITLTLNFRKTKKSNCCCWLVRINNRESEIFLNVSKKELASKTMSELRNLIITDLVHELAHFIDYVREKKETKPTANIKDTYRYISTPTEFNAFFHEIAFWIKKKHKEWGKIKNEKEMEEKILKYIPILENIIEKNPNGYKRLIRRICTRLVRASLMPKQFGR